MYAKENELYELPLKAGHYMIMVKYPGFEQMHQHVIVSPEMDGNLILDFKVEEVEPKEIFVSVKDSQLSNIPGVVIKCCFKGGRSEVEGLTDPDGVATFNVFNNTMYTFTPFKKGFVGAPLDVLFTNDNIEQLKEVKLFVSQASESKHIMEIMLSSSILRANEDYELQLFTCTDTPTEDDPHLKEEDKIVSTEKEEGAGVILKTDEPAFGITCVTYPTEE